MTDDHEILAIAKQLRYDLTAMQGKVTDLLHAIGALNLQTKERPACPHCQLTFKGGASLAEHAYHAHGGPYPEHWAKAEAIAEEAAA